MEDPEDVVATSKRLCDGELRHQEARCDDLNNDRLLNPESTVQTSTIIRVAAGKKSSRSRKTKQETVSKSRKVQDQVGEPVVIEDLANTLSGHPTD